MGHTLVFALSLAALAVRCCLYYAVTNPWWFLPIELLNGVSYGLFHTCMASFASHIAPEGAQATLQAIVRASLTIGQASAGFLGGILYQKLGGAKMFLSVGLFDVGFCIFFGIMQALITKYYDNTKLFGKKGYEVPSRNNSSSGDSSQESHEVGENGTQDKETKRALMDNV
ncbi:hypothetical protein SK128_003090 [Halocaridina rubra]|uniref:Major facilitator superfamily associated domain-containing protein n=1 Tax=Halocaridina rubra TaxID=373956 RepID=A0AAN9A0S7_HALRR